MPTRLARVLIVLVPTIAVGLVALAGCGSAPTLEQAEGVIAQSTRGPAATQAAIAVQQTSVAVKQTSVAADVTATALWDQLYHSQTAVADNRARQASLATAVAPVTQAAAAATAAGIERQAAVAGQTQMWDTWAPRLGGTLAALAIVIVALGALRGFSLAAIDRQRTVVLPAQAPAYIGPNGAYITNPNRQPGPVTAFYPSSRGAWMIALANNLLSGKLQLPPPGAYTTNAVTGGAEQLSSVLLGDQRVQLLNAAARAGGLSGAASRAMAASAAEPPPEPPVVFIEDPADLTEGGRHAGLGQWIAEAQDALEADPRAARLLAGPADPAAAPAVQAGTVNLSSGEML